MSGYEICGHSGRRRPRHITIILVRHGLRRFLKTRSLKRGGRRSQKAVRDIRADAPIKAMWCRRPGTAAPGSARQEDLDASRAGCIVAKHAGNGCCKAPTRVSGNGISVLAACVPRGWRHAGLCARRSEPTYAACCAWWPPKPPTMLSNLREYLHRARVFKTELKMRHKGRHIRCTCTAAKPSGTTKTSPSHGGHPGRHPRAQAL
jgi:hypothetical protein